METSKSHVLMVAPTAVPGGMEEILFNLALELPAAGVTSDVISLHDGPLVDRLRMHAIDVEVIEGGRLRELRMFWRTSRRLAERLRSGRYDAVFSSMPKAHLYVALPGAFQGLPLLWCQAGHPDPPSWLDRLATALPATGVIALSRDSSAAQQKLFPCRSVKMLHPGIDLTRFRVGSDPELRSRWGIAADASLISLVGRLQPWKGQREFLRAAALVLSSNRSAHFAVVGGAILGWEGDYPQELTRLAAQLGVADRVTFTAHSDEPHRWMAASDIVVNVSEPEPFGLVVIEGMATGCPVVAVAKGGPRDIIEDGRSGLLCASRDPSVVAGAITRLLVDEQLRVALGRAARARVESEFSREAMARRFAAIIFEATAAAQPRVASRRGRASAP